MREVYCNHFLMVPHIGSMPQKQKSLLLTIVTHDQGGQRHQCPTKSPKHSLKLLGMLQHPLHPTLAEGKCCREGKIKRHLSISGLKDMNKNLLRNIKTIEQILYRRNNSHIQIKIQKKKVYCCRKSKITE